MSFFGEPPAQLCRLPANEAERLAATRAYEILDTPPDPQFDAITRVAGALFDVPIALIALMDDDRLWFKSRQGLDLAQLDRNIAFCAHAILHEHEIMVVGDLAADPRFAHHPLVLSGPALRFYASAPLVSAQGLALGTIALMDIRPREFTAADRAALGDIAVAVMTALEGHKHNRQLHRLANTDYLTGAANRAAFDQVLQRSVADGAGQRNAFSLLMLDLDGFKGVNDAHGHAAGDTVLREVAKRLQSLCGPGDTLARVGGDEFAVVLGSAADACGASSVAERMLESLDEVILLAGGAEVRVNASVGITSCPEDATDALALLEQADRALYRAKAQHHPRWAMAAPLFGPNCPAPQAGAGNSAKSVPAGSSGAATIGVLRRAAGTASPPDDPLPERCGACIDGIAKPFPFSMAFQPIVDAANRRVFAYEALVRGPGNEGALSVLSKVTARNRYAFDQSCRITAIRLAAELGLHESGASLSINFIPGAMYEPRNCIRATLSAARRYCFPLDRLIFELTEGEEVTDKDKLRNIFAVYAEQGFQTAIDDFGAGYSGLTLLTEFQPRIVKLDMQLIRDIDRHPARLAIVRGVLSMCRELGILVIAEGVESTAEYAVLLELGVVLFQGFLFARPAFEELPAVDFPSV
jgi:diguanylate cyclase (GGDEF)-like protein